MRLIDAGTCLMEGKDRDKDDQMDVRSLLRWHGQVELNSDLVKHVPRSW